MELFIKIILAVLLGWMIFSTWRALKQDPHALSRERVTQSMSLLLKLAVILIAFIAFLVLMLKQG